MTEFYKKEDVIAFLNLHCPKDMWEYQIADLNTIKVMEYADKEQAYMTGYARGRIAGTPLEVVHCSDCKRYVSDGGAMMVCDITGNPTSDNDFCSWAERIE